MSCSPQPDYNNMAGVGSWQSCGAGIAIFVPDEDPTLTALSVQEPSSVDMLMSRMSIDRDSNGGCTDRMLFLYIYLLTQGKL